MLEREKKKRTGGELGSKNISMRVGFVALGRRHFQAAPPMFPTLASVVSRSIVSRPGRGGREACPAYRDALPLKRYAMQFQFDLQIPMSLLDASKKTIAKGVKGRACTIHDTHRQSLDRLHTHYTKYTAHNTPHIQPVTHQRRRSNLTLTKAGLCTAISQSSKTTTRVIRPSS